MSVIAIALIRVLVTWGLLGIGFCGLGFAAAWLLGFERRTVRFRTAFWGGIAAAVLFLQLWHLAFPVDRRALLILAGIGLAGFLPGGKGAVRQLLDGARAHRKTACLMAGAALVIAARSLGPPSMYDSGLYHFAAVRWAGEFPIVPGLGNLHSRLAFNNASFLYDALLNTGPWAGKAYHIANGLLVLALALQGLFAWSRLGGVKGSGGVAVWYDAFTLVLPPILMSRSWVSSYSTDVPAGIVMITGTSLALGLLRPGAMREEEGGPNLVCAAVLFAVSVCMKTTLLVFAAIAWGILVGVWCRDSAKDDRRMLRHAVKAAGVASLLLGSWVFRGIILSGYPLFPAPLAGLPVEWRVPEAEARRAADFVTSHAWRLDKDRWFREWLSHFGRLLHTPIAMAAAALVLVFRKQRLRDTLKPEALLLIPAVIGIAAWLLTAPEKRFGYPFFWVLGPLSIALVLSTPGFSRERKGRKVAAAALAVLCVVHWLSVVGSFREFGSENGFHSPHPHETEPVTVPAGLTVYVPRKGELCWDAPLPCTPRVTPGLRGRNPDDLGAGFMISPPDVSLPPVRLVQALRTVDGHNPDEEPGAGNTP